MSVKMTPEEIWRFLEQNKEPVEVEVPPLHPGEVKAIRDMQDFMKKVNDEGGCSLWDKCSDDEL